MATFSDFAVASPVVGEIHEYRAVHFENETPSVFAQRDVNSSIGRQYFVNSVLFHEHLAGVLAEVAVGRIVTPVRDVIAVQPALRVFLEKGRMVAIFEVSFVEDGFAVLAFVAEEDQKKSAG